MLVLPSIHNFQTHTGHSMSGDPAKWGFFIWPSPKFTKFYKGKDLRPLSSTKLEFLKLELYFRNYEHLKFWYFSRGLDKKILGVLLLELQLIVIPLSLNIFIQYFAVKWKVPCWTKQHWKFFTGDVWTLVNCCYKATCFSFAFKHDDILKTYNSNSATLIDFIFLCKGWCYGDTAVSWSPMLIFELQAKKN